MTVLVLHTLPPEEAEEGRTTGEFDLSEASQAIGAVLPGAIVAGIRGEPAELIQLLNVHRPGVVFNLCEAPQGQPKFEPHLAALLEWLHVRFTGCSSETLWLCRRKDLTNGILAAAGVPVPAPVDPLDPTFPCIVKPADDDGSAGMDADSVCENAEALKRARSRISGPTLVEEFMPGREFAVSLWGQHYPEHFSIGETVFRNGLRLVTYSAKWHVESAAFADSPMYYDSEIKPELRRSIVAAAKGAWHAVGARHLLRVDLRLDHEGRPRVLDVNPNPEIAPEVGISRAVREAGWAWPDFIHKLVEWA
jgi:D-alanine-D-alanine ligase